MGRKTRGGFTLLELTLAMTGLALIVGLCYGAFHLAARAVERGERAGMATQQLRVAGDLMIRQIKSALPRLGDEDRDGERASFRGSPRTMSFVTAGGMRNGGSVSRVVYRYEPARRRLVVEEGPAWEDSDGTSPGQRAGVTRAVLLEGVRRAKFKYLFFDGVATEWRAEWDSRAEHMLPAAVRVLVDARQDGSSVWGQEIPVMVGMYGGLDGQEPGADDEAADNETPDAK